MNTHKEMNLSALCQQMSAERETEWLNIGGQIMKKKDVDQIRSDIGKNKLNDWDQIHSRYDTLWGKYPLQKQQHAFATLCDLLDTKIISQEQWIAALQKAEKIQESISEQVYISRKKDFDNPFRHATFRNSDEMTATIGTIDENSFVQQIKDETKQFKKLIHQIRNRG